MFFIIGLVDHHPLNRTGNIYTLIIDQFILPDNIEHQILSLLGIIPPLK